MITRLLRAALAWLRHYPHARADAKRAAETRARAEGYLAMSRTHRETCLRLFDQAASERDFAARQTLYLRAMAAECRAEACLRLAGCGDYAAEEAAALIRQAQEYDAESGAPRYVRAVQQEAAHA